VESEAQLEESLVKQLEQAGYVREDYILNEEHLKANLRRQLNRVNDSVLGDHELSDSEFSRVLAQLEGKGVFQSAQLLETRVSREAKIPLQRDDNSTVYLMLFSANPARNRYQVVNQLRMHTSKSGFDRKTRFDVTLLVNGLPLVQIELKKRGVAIKDAHAQINRYRRDAFTGLFSFLRLFVVSNGTNTRYFANSNFKEDIPFARAFVWQDRANTKVNELHEFANIVLRPEMLVEMLSTWMVLQVPEKALVVMRPYQIYAVKAVLNQVLETGGNGYVWHTTGSGKTLTAWRAATLICQQDKFASGKVIFLVDRSDLNLKTMEDFNNYAEGSVDQTENTGKLVEQLNSTEPKTKLIVTTLQKMDSALKHNQVPRDLAEKNVLFMMDECHRSQFGDMHERIRKYFKRAQYIGFTGTPIFKENLGTEKRTTADVFGRRLHTYLMPDAIMDGNVLRFNVEYVDTGVPNEKFRDELAESLDLDEAFHAPERLDNITQDVITEFNRKTHAGTRFNAILAAGGVQLAAKYWRRLHKAAPKLKLALIYTWAANENYGVDEIVPRDELDAAIEVYNEQFGTNFDTSRMKEYFTDLSKRMRAKEIDILIVSDMFLTGSDFPRVNTLFYDKSARHHTLIQHISRTNRTLGDDKNFGNVRFYRPLKERLDAALRLFSQSEHIDQLLARPYDAVLADLRAAVAALKLLAPAPAAVDDYVGEDEQVAFVNAFKQVNRLLAEIEPHEEFVLNTATAGVSTEDLADYRSKYLDLHDAARRGSTDKVSILAEIDFELHLVQRDQIDADYIRELLRSIDLSDLAAGARKSTVDEILKQVERDPVLRLKSELLRTFFSEMLPTLPEGTDVVEAYDAFEDRQREIEIETQAAASDIPVRTLEGWVNDYQLTNLLPSVGDLLTELTGAFMVRRRKVNTIQSFIQELTLKYS
jgi:type I restriction enzyme R subunit